MKNRVLLYSLSIVAGILMGFSNGALYLMNHETIRLIFAVAGFLLLISNAVYLWRELKIKRKNG
jgi:hypothetical protein